MTMNSNDINWKNFILPVATDIFGEPTSQSNDMIRFGAKGSKVININSGTFYDHENGVGGGCIDLLRHYYPDEKPIKVLQERYKSIPTYPDTLVPSMSWYFYLVPP